MESSDEYEGIGELFKSFESGYGENKSEEIENLSDSNQFFD
jgi:hypothetical protein